MISVEQALEIVHNSVVTTSATETISVVNALGCTLSEAVVSPISMPPFRQSAMDGYALNLTEGVQYTLIGEIKAGDPFHPILKKGDAVRIFTGAPVPDTANAIAVQEKASVTGDGLQLHYEVAPGSNIRDKGEQVTTGQIALQKGALLTPAAIGFITTLGVTELCVFRKPSIAIVSTGNELVAPGSELKYGQIYESNTSMLASALHGLGYLNLNCEQVNDHYGETLTVLRKMIDLHDLVLISGGISVGEYDFVGKALNELGVEELFYKVRQKPGKPLYFGRKDQKLVFALPGNPAASLSCFYVYALPALRRLSGNRDCGLPRTTVRSVTAFQNNADRAQFLKAYYKDGTVTILDGQSSSTLHTFALANALVYLPEHKRQIEVNDEVEIILLPTF
jgi:molybdopterin molybdotransferase